MDPPPLPDRKHPAHQPVFKSGNLSQILFVTICSKDRKPILAKPDIHHLLVSIWQDPTSHWIVGRYVILLDHIHLFCSPRSEKSLSIHRWVSFWKSECSKKWPRPDEHPVWQVNAWDTQLRKGENYDAKWQYVRMNPVRHDLVKQPDD